MRQLSAILAAFLITCAASNSCHRTEKVGTPPTIEKRLVPEKHLAPDGTFFLTERVAVTTTSGVVALPPGAKVTLIATDGHNLRITDGTIEAAVHQSQLTNDLDVARDIAAADREAQTQVARLIAEQQRDYERQRAEQQAALAREQSLRTLRPAAPRWNNPLDRPVYNRTQDKKYLDSNGKTYWIDVQGRRHYDN